MGKSRGTAQFVAKVDRYAKAMGEANRAGVSAAALRHKEQAIRNITADTGGDRRLSQYRARFGLSQQSPKMGAGYRLFGHTNAKAIVSPRPYGLWALVDSGSAPHRITPFAYKRKKGGGMRAAEVAALARGGGKRRALAIPGAGRGGAGFAAYADHPGSAGKGTFRAVPRQSRFAAVRSFHRSHSESLLKAFR